MHMHVHIHMRIYIHEYIHIFRFKNMCQSRTMELRTEHFVAGGFISGTVAAVATAPIDLIKTRIQVHTHIHT